MRSGGRGAVVLCCPRPAGCGIRPWIHTELVGRRQPDSRTVGAAHPEGGGPNPEGRDDGRKGGGRMRAAIYARVSTLDQEPENQLQELRRYVEPRGWTPTEFVDR